MVFESENFVHFCNCPNLTKNKNSVGDSKKHISSENKISLSDTKISGYAH